MAIDLKSVEVHGVRTRAWSGPPRPASRALALALVLLGALAPALAAKEPAKAADPRVAAAHDLAEALRVAVGSPGMSVAVAVGPDVVWAEGLGEADAENHVPVDPKTRFRVGSLSKLLTVALAARLLEEGKLELDAPIQRYVPSFPVKDAAKPITPRQLAGHLGGIRHYMPQDFMRAPKTYSDLTEALEIFRDDPLIGAPGEKYFYSSYGYNLLGAALEGAGGGEFSSLVGRYVLEPLHLAATTADDPEALLEFRARPYLRLEGGALRNEKAIDSRFKLPSGGFVSTASDVARFATAHADPGYLKKETLELLITSQTTMAGEETGVGFGWRLGKDAAGRRFLHHGGAIEGGRAMLVLYPEEKLAIAVLTNLSRAHFGEADAQKVAAPFLGTPSPAAVPAPPR